MKNSHLKLLTNASEAVGEKLYFWQTQNMNRSEVHKCIVKTLWPKQNQCRWKVFELWKLKWKIQGVCLELSQKFYLISRLFLEIETWYFTWRCSIMGHLIIKKWFDHYHLLDISNDCVKKFKDFRRFDAKNMAISHSRRRIPQNWPKLLI